MYSMTIHSIFYIYLLLFTLCPIEPVLFLPPELLFLLFLTSGATFLLQKAKILNFPLNTIWNAMLFFWIFLFTCDNSLLWTCYTFILYFVSFATYDILPYITVICELIILLGYKIFKDMVQLFLHVLHHIGQNLTHRWY